VPLNRAFRDRKASRYVPVRQPGDPIRVNRQALGMAANTLHALGIHQKS